MSAPDHVERLAARLRHGPHGRARLVSAPGCWDGLSALLIEQAGFELAFLTGAGLSMARLGRPDLGLVHLGELAEAAGAIRDRIELPLLVDADAGFGAALNVARTVRLLERAGASAIQIEDQVSPKRSGHMAGKAVVPLGEALDRLKAALDARVHTLVSARTDAAGVLGIDAALERAEAFLEIGADLVFVEGLSTPAQVERIGRQLGGRAPLVCNLVEGADWPVGEPEALEALGFAVALHPLVLLHGYVRQAPSWLRRLAAARTTAGFADELSNVVELNALVAGAARQNSVGPARASG